MNDFYQKNFVIVDFEFIKSIIVIFQIVEKQKSFLNRRRFRKKIVVFALIKTTFD